MTHEPNRHYQNIPAHLHHGFAEAQRVIQFQDVKSATLTGLATLAFGFALTLVGKFATDQNGSIELARLHWDWINWVLFGGSGVFMILSLVAAVLCLVPRRRKWVWDRSDGKGWQFWKKRPMEDSGHGNVSADSDTSGENEDIKGNVRFCTLFPYYDAEDSTHLAAIKATFEELRGLPGAAQDKAFLFVCNEYEDQAKKLGEILFLKIAAVRWGVLFLLAELFFVIGFSLYLFVG